MELVRDLLANRIGGAEFGKSTKIYKFAMIKNAKQKVLSEKPDAWIIDLGVGEPDQPASQVVVDRLSAEAGKAENRWYSDNGIDELGKQPLLT